MRGSSRHRRQREGRMGVRGIVRGASQAEAAVVVQVEANQAAAAVDDAPDDKRLRALARSRFNCAESRGCERKWCQLCALAPRHCHAP